MPICSPPCEGGLLCSAGGMCVAAESLDQPAPAPLLTPPPTSTGNPWSPPVDGCYPGCRTGFTCIANRCASLCNPICSVGERCTAQGECVTQYYAEPARQTQVAPPAARDPHESAIVNLHLDTLGALQFGLTPTLEVGTIVSGFLRLRVLNSGLASYFVLGRDAHDELRWGAGAALGLHVFSAERGHMRGFYGGLALEYAYLETRDTTQDFATYATVGLVPQLDGGYRWGFGGLLVGLSVRLGLAIPVQNRATAFGDDGCRRSESCVEKYDVAFIPGIALDLGWFIPNAD